MAMMMSPVQEVAAVETRVLYPATAVVRPRELNMMSFAPSIDDLPSPLTSSDESPLTSSNGSSNLSPLSSSNGSSNLSPLTSSNDSPLTSSTGSSNSSPLTSSNGLGSPLTPSGWQVPEDMARQTAEMVRDLIMYTTKQTQRRAANKYTETMRRVVNEQLVRFRIVFRKMIRDLSITHDNAHNVAEMFQQVCDHVFADRDCNWGRIATVFAFAAMMAQHVVDAGISNGVRYENVIADALVAYVNTSLTPWIHNAGGWDAFCEYFPSEDSRENSVRTGLLTVGLALGAIATLLAFR